MPARLFLCNLRDAGSGEIQYVDSNRSHGIWSPGLDPGHSAVRITPGQSVAFQSESSGVLTGTEAWALFKTRASDSAGLHDAFLKLSWSVPYWSPEKAAVNLDLHRFDPRNNTGSVFVDPRPPNIQVTREFRGPADQESLLSQVRDFPWLAVWGAVSMVGVPIEADFHPRLDLAVSGSVADSGSLKFPPTVPTPQEQAMADFRQRAQFATDNGFVGAFPNFYEAIYGRAHVGGTILLSAGVAEWRDVPWADLGSPPLTDFGERMRAAQNYASRNGYVGGFPTYYHADTGSGIVCGTILVKAGDAEWRDVPLTELGNPALDDIGARFRGTQDYAVRNGFVGGFPNFFHAEKRNPVRPEQSYIVCGTILVKSPSAQWRDVTLNLLPA